MLDLIAFEGIAKSLPSTTRILRSPSRRCLRVLPNPYLQQPISLTDLLASGLRVLPNPYLQQQSYKFHFKNCCLRVLPNPYLQQLTGAKGVSIRSLRVLPNPYLQQLRGLIADITARFEGIAKSLPSTTLRPDGRQRVMFEGIAKSLPSTTKGFSRAGSPRLRVLPNPYLQQPALLAFCRQHCLRVLPNPYLQQLK